MCSQYPQNKGSCKESSLHRQYNASTLGHNTTSMQRETHCTCHAFKDQIVNIMTKGWKNLKLNQKCHEHAKPHSARCIMHTHLDLLHGHLHINHDGHNLVDILH